MRTIQIGDRKTEDLNKHELIDFMYDFGYCCSPEFFDKPVITQFEYDEKFNAIFFDYNQIRKEDGLKIEDSGQIYLTGYKNHVGKYECSIFLTRFKNFEFGAHELNHFIKLGFDLPIY